MATVSARIILFVLAGRLVLGPGIASAQSDTTSLTVVVTDESRAAVPGAAVTLRNTATSAQREAVTDAAGRVSFTVLPPGTYETVVSLSGCKKFRDPAVHLQVGQPATLNVPRALPVLIRGPRPVGGALDTRIR